MRSDKTRGNRLAIAYNDLASLFILAVCILAKKFKQLGLHGVGNLLLCAGPQQVC